MLHLVNFIVLSSFRRSYQEEIFNIDYPTMCILQDMSEASAEDLA